MELYLLLLIIAIPLIAESKVKTNYEKFSRIQNSHNMTGYEVARKILDSNGLTDIKIVQTHGELTDHYDPRQKVIRLSNNIYSKTSISAIAVAAHEVGHALQHKEDYSFLKLRTKMVPAVNFTSNISTILIFLGLFLEFTGLLYLSAILMIISLAFQFITLPVEFDASSRAKEQLTKLNIITAADNKGVTNVLSAAAFTYIAGFLATALQILRYITIAKRND